MQIAKLDDKTLNWTVTGFVSSDMAHVVTWIHILCVK